MKNRNFLFICGYPSSGTELLKSFLRAHSQVWIGEEFPFLPDIARRYSARSISDRDIKDIERDLAVNDIYNHMEVKAISEEDVRTCQSLADVYGRMLTQRSVRWIGNKTPQYSERLHDIYSAFPSARIILIVRDIRDVALSWVEKWGKNPIWCADKWQSRMIKARNDMAITFGSNGLIITYENLLSDTKGTANMLCDFLEIEYEDRMLRFYETEEKIIDGKRNYGDRILNSNSGKWKSKLADKTVRRIEEIAYDAMALYGYKPSHPVSPRPIRINEKIKGVINDIWALVAVGNRAIKKDMGKEKRTAIVVELKKLWWKVRR